MTHTQTAESVIWIASYPKSGNTWVQTVVRAAGRTYGFPNIDLDVYKMKAEKRTPEVVGGIRKEICKENTTVLKTHNSYSRDRDTHPELGLKTTGFVYVMRNPLDMLLSYINFTRMQYEKNKETKAYQEILFIDLLGFEKALPYEEWVEMKLEDIPRVNLDHALCRFTALDTDIPGVKMAGGSWLSHCLSWHEAGKTLPSVFLKYEDLLKGPEYFLPLKKLFVFSDDQIIDAVDSVNQRQRGLQYKRVFFNKMSSYYYSELFSNDAISKFLKRFETELKAFGYANLCV